MTHLEPDTSKPRWKNTIRSLVFSELSGPLTDLAFRAMSLVNVFPFVPSDLNMGGLFVHREQQLYVFYLPKRKDLVFVALTAPYGDSLSTLLRAFSELLSEGDFK